MFMQNHFIAIWTGSRLEGIGPKNVKKDANLTKRISVFPKPKRKHTFEQNSTYLREDSQLTNGGKGASTSSFQMSV